MGQPPPTARRKPERPKPQYGRCLYGARAWKSWRRPVIKTDRALALCRFNKRLYFPRGSREPGPGTQAREAAGSDQLLVVPGKPVPGAAGGGEVRAAAGVPVAAAENAVRTDASGAVAVVSAEVGRAVADDGTANRHPLARGSVG